LLIQINTDHNINGAEKLRDTLIHLLNTELSRYSSQITRIEVHLADEDGDTKDGKNDIRCILETRLEGRRPIAVTNHADTWYSAAEGAINKLKASLETIVGKLSRRTQ
jgi:ribosome-associated translation inhibitor RaiA